MGWLLVYDDYFMSAKLDQTTEEIKIVERLRFTFTPNGKREFVPRDQGFPLIFPLLFIVSTQK